jgi:hypothetical protein
LQGVLAISLLCGIILLTLGDASKVFPKSLGTVARVASLFADRRLTDEKEALIPEGTECLSDSEIQKRGLWAGEMFRMGWWNDHQNKTGSSYIGIGPPPGQEKMGEHAYFEIDVRLKKHQG